jgi:hypothetical protein
MMMDSLCLSANNDSDQVRYAQTKAQQFKSDLKVNLSGIINGKKTIWQADQSIRRYFSEYLNSKKRSSTIDKKFLIFLDELLSIDGLPVPGSNSLNALELIHNALGKFKDQFYELVNDILLVYEKESNIRLWEKLFHNFAYFINHGNNYGKDSLSQFVFRIRRILSELIPKKDAVQILSGNNDLFRRIIGFASIDQNESLFISCCNFCLSSAKLTIEVKEKLLLDCVNFDYSCFSEKLTEFCSIDKEFIEIYYHESKIINEVPISNLLSNLIFTEEKHLKYQIILQLLNENGAHNVEIRKIVPNILEVFNQVSKDNWNIIPKFISQLFFIKEYYDELPIDSVRLINALVFFLNNISHSINDIESIDRVIKGSYYDFKHFYRDVLAHLFFKYEKPWALLHNIEFLNPDEIKCLEHIVRTNHLNGFTNLPSYLKPTKKESHLFLIYFSRTNVPSLTNNVLERAIALIKLKSTGVNDSFINIFNESNARRTLLQNLEFWKDVARFIKRYEQHIRNGEIRDILDYLDHCIANNRKYEIKGRTITSLRRALRTWHDELATYGYLNLSGKNIKWNGLPLPNEFLEFKKTNYIIVQLRSALSLIKEGRIQHHCVATYTDNKQKRLITIEIKNNNIIQAKGKFNRLPELFEESIIKKWAAKNNMKLSAYCFNY